MATLNAPIILLKEGTDTSQGKPQIIANINACMAVADVLRTTLGPKGMDKMIVSENDVTVSNDGATLISKLDIQHPAALCLVDISNSQDEEVGDGTTSVVLLAAELLNEAKSFLEMDIPPQIIRKAYRQASKLAISKIEECEVDLSSKSPEEKRSLLLQCAMTALNSKLVSSYKKFFAELVVDAVLTLPSTLDADLIGVKKVTGGSCDESMLIKGVAFKKTFSYAGFEQQPKKLINPKIALLNIELELKAEKENAEIRLSSPMDYQSIVDAEWKLIYQKLEIIVEKGCNIVLSKLPIGDIATQFFADHSVFCAGRVEENDIKRIAAATNASIQSTVNGLNESCFGTCDVFEEMQIGSERYNIFKCGENTKSSTLILRGGANQFLEEAERSLHDATMIVRRALNNHSVVGGGGAIEMHISKFLRDFSRKIPGRMQPILSSYAKALECIPKALAHNSGYDATNVLNLLRHKHFQSNDDTFKWIGVDCYNGNVCDTFNNYIWEPSIVKKHAISAATEAACLIIGIDETINCNNNEPNRMPGR